MPSINPIVAEAREWIGTPYVHQHRMKGVACDCVGLIIGVGLALDILPRWSPEAWRPHSRYGRMPNPAHMTKAIAEFLDPLDLSNPQVQIPDGAVAFMGWRPGLPMHLAIIGTAPDGRRTMVHAFNLSEKVVEHGFAEEWPDRVESFWMYPEGI